MKEAIEILKKIESYGHKAYIVGGAVRDYYMNKTSKDIDICTSATPEQLREIFKDASLDNYGCTILNFADRKYEITTFRKESHYQDNRHPSKITFVKKLKTDLKRRDFCMNAICLTSDLNYIDYFDGRGNINKGLVKMIGKPKKRLKEDSLRILRAVRLGATLNFKLDEELALYIKEYGYLLRNLSYTHKKNELEKIFLSENVTYGIKMLLDLELDKALELNHLEKLVLTPSLIALWAQIASPNYPFSKAEKYLINGIRKVLEADLFDVHTLYNSGLVIIKLAGEIKKLDLNKLEVAYNLLPIKSIRDVALTPEEIILMVKKDYKDVIVDLEHQLLTKKVNNTKEEIIAYLDKKYNNK
jgi:tRNA nucleotidyltransferase (CCA-adding enzyme)